LTEVRERRPAAKAVFDLIDLPEDVRSLGFVQTMSNGSGVR